MDPIKNQTNEGLQQTNKNDIRPTGHDPPPQTSKQLSSDDPLSEFLQSLDGNDLVAPSEERQSSNGDKCIANCLLSSVDDEEFGLKKSNSASRFRVLVVDTPVNATKFRQDSKESSSSPTASSPKKFSMATTVLASNINGHATKNNGLQTAPAMHQSKSESVVMPGASRFVVSSESAAQAEDAVDSGYIGRPSSKSVTFHVGGCPSFDAETNGGNDQQLNVDTLPHGCSQNSSYDTQNAKSFRHVETIERLPNINHYRNLLSVAGAMASRPTLTDLHAADDLLKEVPSDLELGQLPLQDAQVRQVASVGASGKSVSPVDAVVIKKGSGPKFGWIQGVLIRCILNIIGVMLYLRLSWITGQAGIAVGSAIILLSCLVTTLTALSMCAISTNGEVRGGGAYFMISRSLGPQFGGSIGVIFAFANAVATAMYIVGFAETVVALLKAHELQIVDGAANDIRIVGLATAVLLLAITIIGLSFEAKAQLFLLAILLVSVLNFYIGTVVPPSDEKQAKGMTGYSYATLSENFFPAWRDGEGFFSVFAVFFPAATGILAGANISGDLQDPQKSIPKGTLLAIAITSVIYLSCLWLCGATMLRDASGSLAEFANGTFTSCAFNSSCEYGLMNHAQVMELESGWGPLITAGIFAATLSSALASLVSAPKVLQAVGNDRLFPVVHIVARGYGKSNEPRRAYLLTFVIAAITVLIGDLNAIAPIISNFFLAAYALVNYATFDASLAKSPGFRPSFKFYNMWLSLAGALLCVSVMFVINWWAALATLGFITILYMYVRQRKLEVNWGSSSQAHSYKNALIAMHRLQWTEEHVKNYRPQVLILSGNPVSRPSLVDFVANVTKDTSLMICGHIVLVKNPEKVIAEHYILALQKFRFQIMDWFCRRHIKSFYNPVTAGSFREGVQSLLQLSGLGKLRINVVIIGFKNNWRSSPKEQVLEYFHVIHDCFDANLGVGILRVAGGLDFSEPMRQHNLHDSCNLHLPSPGRPTSLLTQHSSTANLGSFHHIPVLFGGSASGGGGADTSEKAVIQKNRLCVTLSGQSRRESSECEFVTAESSPCRQTAIDKGLVSGGGGTPLEANNVAPAMPGNCVAKSSSTKSTVNKLAAAFTRTATPIPAKRFVSPLMANGRLGIFSRLRRGSNQSAGSSVNDARSRTPSGTYRGGDQSAEETVPLQQKPVSELALDVVDTPRLNEAMNRFARKVKKATIDVWWLYDDGGLSLLVPHLFSMPKSYLEGAKLRVFTVASSRSQLEQEQRSMAALLSKFRINFSDVQVIPDITKKPAAKNLHDFEDLVKDFKISDEEDSTEPNSGLICEAELLAQKEKTWRIIRTRELLLQHSQEASLVVVTLPVPRKGACSAMLYMSWLETLTKDVVPPILLLRGNQQSVLTFYS